jgi:biopolymer transport protein ExbD
MAFSVQEEGGRRRFGRSRPLADINVIPLVDVVLVLLIIFMLTAHVMEFGLEVEVPKVRQVRESAEELPVVTITKTGDFQLNEQPININQLGAEVRRRFPKDKAVYVRADKNTIYDPIAQVISALSEAKIEVRLITQPFDEADQRR